MVGGVSLASPVHNSEPSIPQVSIQRTSFEAAHTPVQLNVRRARVCHRQAQLDPRSFTSCQYSVALRAVQRSHPHNRAVLRLPSTGATAVQRKTLYWIAYPAQYSLMRRETAAGKYYKSPHAALWYLVNDNECKDNWPCNTGNGYYGGLQMDRKFQRTYNPAAYALWGTANNWPIAAQMLAADRAYASRGLKPWPHSYAAYGLRPVP